ncbi:unnamed protein product [Malus baccata var. baccata]
MVAHAADFGIARPVGDGDSMTETMTLATIGYMDLDEVVDADILGMEEDRDFTSRRDCFSSVMRLALACSAIRED